VIHDHPRRIVVVHKVPPLGHIRHLARIGLREGPMLLIFEMHDSVLFSTRKLCYRKDDRAMRPIYGALKIFWTP